MKRLCPILLLGALLACGDGGNNAPTTPATPVPTPTPVTYNGTYTSTTMRVPGGWMISATVTVRHNGSILDFSNLEVTDPPDWGWWGMGRAPLTENTFEGTKDFMSTSCGVATNHYSGWFSSSGDLMNLTCRITSDCPEYTVRGEMRRSPLATSTGGLAAPSRLK